MYMRLDTSLVTPEKPYAFEIYLKEAISKKYRQVRLISVYIHHETDTSKLFAFSARKIKDKTTNIIYKPIHIHCNLLTMDDNLINKENSDVIGTLYPVLKAEKNLYIKFPNIRYKILTSKNCIQLYLTDTNNVPVEHQINYYIIYELEFS